MLAEHHTLDRLDTTGFFLALGIFSTVAFAVTLNSPGVSLDAQPNFFPTWCLCDKLCAPQT